MNNKQLLQKYVDTGAKLPEYQVRSLPDNLRNTYIRKRLIEFGQIGYDFLEDYEFELLTPKQIRYNTIKMAEKGFYISDDQLELLTPDQQIQYAMKLAEKGQLISDDQFRLLTQDQMEQYLKIRVEKGYYISNYIFNLLTPEQQKIFKNRGGEVY